MWIKNVLKGLVLVAVVAVLFVGYSNLQGIYDWWKLRDYQPSARVVKLADKTTMLDNTRRVFYINHPEIQDKQAFSQSCRAVEATIVLGCFINHQGIYLLDVKDERLAGVIEVTAAHEVLHALYERLDKSERERVDKMTSEFFATVTNERIIRTVEDYRSKDPSVVPNELHSILGTEVRNLSPQLEEHYKKYFKERQQIVAYSENYEKSFVEIENKAKDYDARLASLKSEIDANRAELETTNRELDGMQKQIDSLLAGGKISEYNQQVPVYNRKVNEYNTLANQTKRIINEYNSLIDERNDLAIQQQELYKAIDSNSVNEKSR